MSNRVLVAVFIAFAVISLASLNVPKKIVVIDPGHGGKDNGVVFNGVNEKDLVLEIAKLVKAMNTNDDLEIVVLREKDDFMTLKERSDAVNKLNPSILISLHANSSMNDQKSGVEAYCLKDGLHFKFSQSLAEQLTNSLSSTTMKKSGVKTANFALLKNVNCPATLVELGYLSNSNDFIYLTSLNGKIDIAKSILQSINQ